MQLNFVPNAAHGIPCCGRPCASRLLCGTFAREAEFSAWVQALPVYLIVCAAMSSFLIETHETLPDTSAITLTCLLVLIGMKYVTLTLMPVKPYMTYGD